MRRFPTAPVRRAIGGGPLEAVAPALPAPTRPAPRSRWTFYQVALVGMVVTYVWRIQQIFPVFTTLQLTSLSTFVALGLFVLARLNAGGLPSRTDPVFRGATFILLWMFVSIPFGVYPGLSLGFIFQDHIKTFLFMVLLAAAVRTVRDVERFMVVQILAAILYCWYALTSIDVGEDGRFPGLVYYDANDFAMLIVCTLPFLVYFARPGSRPSTRFLSLAAAVPFLMTLVKTGSRGGFIGLIVVGGYLLFAFKGVPRRIRIGAVACAVAGLLVLGGSQYWERMATLLEPTEDYNWAGNTYTGRMEIWKRGFGYMLQRPITGVGPSAFYVAEGVLSDMAALAEFGVGFRWSAPHSSYVQIGAELGFVGLIAFLFLLRGSFESARSFARGGIGGSKEAADRMALGQAFCAAILGYAVTAVFLSQAYAAFFYGMLGLVIGMARIPSPADGPRPISSIPGSAGRSGRRAHRLRPSARRLAALGPEPAG